MYIKHSIMLALGIALTIFVVSMFGLEEVISALFTANPFIIIFAGLIQLLVLAIYIERIKILSKKRGHLSYTHAARLTLSGMFVSMLTPLAKLGGEPLKMYMLRKSIGSQNASAAIAVESIMEIASSITLVVAVMVIFFGSIPPAFVSTLIIFLGVISVALGIFLKILFTPRWLYRIVNWVSNKITRLMEVKKKDYTDMFTSVFYDMWKDKQLLSATFGVSILSKIAEIVRFWLVLLALGASVPLHTVVLVWTILLVVLFIPWLPGSLGIAELGGISALIAFGVPASTAASAIIIDRLLSFWLPLIIGFVAISWAKHKNELPNLSWKKQHMHAGVSDDIVKNV